LYGFDLEDIFSPLLQQWERVGLIKMDSGWMELTLAGEFWQVNICQALIDYFALVVKEKGIKPGERA